MGKYNEPKLILLGLVVLTFSFSGCATEPEIEIHPKNNPTTESGFKKLLREKCPNIEELTAQGLNCDGVLFDSFNESGNCLPGEFEAYNEGGELACVTQEEMDQYGEDRLNELIDQSN